MGELSLWSAAKMTRTSCTWEPLMTSMSIPSQELETSRMQRLDLPTREMPKMLERFLLHLQMLCKRMENPNQAFEESVNVTEEDTEIHARVILSAEDIATWP